MERSLRKVLHMDQGKDQTINEYEPIVREYIKGIEEFGVSVERAYVFGSRIKGTDRKDSDLDVCIVSPAFGGDSIAERVFLMGMAHKINDTIEPHPISPREFNNKYNLLAQEIKRTGFEVKK